MGEAMKSFPLACASAAVAQIAHGHDALTQKVDAAVPMSKVPASRRSAALESFSLGQPGTASTSVSASAVGVKRILIVTDAWHPQVNGVVRTLDNTARELESMGIEVQMLTPLQFRTLPCPTYPEIRLSITSPQRVMRMIEALDVDALHIATEGPLGWCARHCAISRGWRFTTAYHTRFPEYVQARTGRALEASYRLLAWFHRAAHKVLAPTPAIAQVLRNRGFGQVENWSRGVDHAVFYPRVEQAMYPRRDEPIFLSAGRLSVEKNITAFLDLDLPGQKWVAGQGPLEQSLRKRYPQVQFLGLLDPDALAMAYSQADVFVFPSRTDTFGLVMAEAMACGLPVAAFPVPGPVDVVGQSGAGVMDQDLRQACLSCLDVARVAAIERAAAFTWARASTQFLDALVPMRARSES